MYILQNCTTDIQMHTFLRVVSEIEGLMLPDVLHQKRGDLSEDVLQDPLEESLMGFCV